MKCRFNYFVLYYYYYWVPTCIMYNMSIVLYIIYYIIQDIKPRLNKLKALLVVLINFILDLKTS